MLVAPFFGYFWGQTATAIRQLQRGLQARIFSTQRLVSRAMADGLIQVRLNHRIGACMDLEAALRDRFGLTRCRVVPGLGAGADPVLAIGSAAAAELERVQTTGVRMAYRPMGLDDVDAYALGHWCETPAADGGGSAVLIYSRSQLGRGDMGVNLARVKRWAELIVASRP